MKKRILIIAGLAALVLTGSVYAVVRHERENRNRPFAERIVGHLTRQLALTDVQQGKVKALIEAERQKVAPLFAQAAKNRQQLRESTANGKFDEAQVRAVAAEQAQTVTELIVARERVKAKIYNDVLTPEQRTKADQLLQRMEGHFRNHMRDGVEATVPVVP
jgi:Spy/CpxP family protein refolding chaperone